MEAESVDITSDFLTHISHINLVSIPKKEDGIFLDND